MKISILLTWVGNFSSSSFRFSSENLDLILTILDFFFLEVLGFELRALYHFSHSTKVLTNLLRIFNIIQSVCTYKALGKADCLCLLSYVY
jgi:uncharacterized protein YecE (DUF72 family)